MRNPNRIESCLFLRRGGGTADALDSKSSGETREGSNPSPGTSILKSLSRHAGEALLRAVLAQDAAELGDALEGHTGADERHDEGAQDRNRASDAALPA